MPWGFNIATLLDVARKLDRAFEAIEKQGKALERVADRLDAIDKRLDALEQREELLVERTKTAAATAASTTTTAHMGDLWRRVTLLEERARLAGEGDGPRRLPRADEP